MNCHNWILHFEFVFHLFRTVSGLITYLCITWSNLQLITDLCTFTVCIDVEDTRLNNFHQLASCSCDADLLEAQVIVITEWRFMNKRKGDNFLNRNNHFFVITVRSLFLTVVHKVKLICVCVYVCVCVCVCFTLKFLKIMVDDLWTLAYGIEIFDFFSCSPNARHVYNARWCIIFYSV